MTRTNKIILIIEDESSIADLLKDELSTQGHRVVCARNGVEGLALLQETEPDLIICDRAMPVMTGYELLERIRGVYPQYKELPFIFLTALTDQSDRSAVKHLSPTAYLEKPIDFQKLSKTVDQIFAAA